MKIAIAGDWHGKSNYAKYILKELKKQDVDMVIHVGDLAILWDTKNPERCSMAKVIDKAGIEFLFIDGNHDNHDTLQGLEDTQITENIRYMPRGSTLEIDGLTFGFLGGAYSIDADWREEGLDWWRNEEPTEEEAEPLLDKDLDVLITHEAPIQFPVKKMIQLPLQKEHRSEDTRVLVQKVLDATKPKKHYFGHWHQSKTHQVGDTECIALHMEWNESNIAILDTEDLK